jgi:hypothetical protein
MTDSRFDARMNDADLRLTRQLDETPPCSTPDGLVDRVLAASMPLLASGRTREAHRLRLSVVMSRVAVAAVLAMAVVAVFWSMPQRTLVTAPGLPIAVAPGERPSGMLVASGPFGWRDDQMLTLLQVRDIGFDDALGDLETVVHTVGTGRSSMLGLVGHDGPYDRVESELLTVTRVAGGAS